MPATHNHTPASFPVSVILEKRPSSSPWADNYWTAVGVVIGEQTAPPMTRLHEQDGVEQFIYTGLRVTLYVDQCESYYHNLNAPQPSCYIIAHLASNGTPTPFIVSMSFDEAHAHLEGDDEVYSVPVPPELYVWSESFMLEHYCPEKKKKRKRTDWRQDTGAES